MRTRYLSPAVAIATLCLLAFALPAVAEPPAERGVPARSLDADFAWINDQIAGFGGLYEGRDGRLKAVLTDPAAAPRLEAELGREVDVIRGRYEFRDLQSWRLEIRSILSHPGVNTLDVDERANRVRIGIEPGQRRAVAREIRRELRKMGIPRRAVRFSERRAMIPLQTNVQGAFNPIPGGVQINFPGFLCTLGFNVKLGSNCYFVTNDHCTANSGQNDNTPFGQPLLSVNTFAEEVFDPPFFTGAGCFPGSVCRFSDAAAARYDDPNECEFGAIARTPVGSLNLDTPDRWNIIAKQLTPLANQLVAKQGRTTGRTEGRVQATCQDTGVSGTNQVRLCQATVTNNGQVVVQGGDSGSPVFRRRVATSQAQLVGILWGGNVQGTEFVYSPMENIEADFGRSLPVF